MLDPPPCHCGKIGLYIVGKITYCRAHREEAIQSQATKWRTGMAMKRSVDISTKRKARDYRDLARNPKAAGKHSKK